MAHGVGPLGKLPLSRQPFIPARAFVPQTDCDDQRPNVEVGERSGTPDGFVVDAGRRIDAFAQQAHLTEDQSAEFDAASESFLKAVASIRSERLGSLQTAQRTQLALEDFARRLDSVGGSDAGATGKALTALVGELQHVFDTAFSQPASQEDPPQIFFPRFEERGASAQRASSAYGSEATSRGLPPDSSIDTIA